MPNPTTQADRDELLDQCIELAKAEANGGRHDCFCGMRDELAELRALADKLPLTKDGVRVVPGMTVFSWMIHEAGGYAWTGVDIFAIKDGVLDGMTHGYQRVRVQLLPGRVYASAELAQAATEGGG